MTVKYFARIVLARLGPDRAGWKAIFANDIEPTRFRMHCSNYDWHNNLRIYKSKLLSYRHVVQLGAISDFAGSEG